MKPGEMIRSDEWDFEEERQKMLAMYDDVLKSYEFEQKYDIDELLAESEDHEEVMVAAVASYKMVRDLEEEIKASIDECQRESTSSMLVENHTLLLDIIDCHIPRYARTRPVIYADLKATRKSKQPMVHDMLLYNNVKTIRIKAFSNVIQIFKRARTRTELMKELLKGCIEPNPGPKMPNRRRRSFRKRRLNRKRGYKAVQRNISAGPIGKRKFVINSVVDLKLTAGLGAFQINPGSIINASRYAPLLQIFNKWRVTGYKFKLFCPINNGTNNNGSMVSWLCKEGGPVAIDYQTLACQPGAVFKNLWQPHFHTWKPIEAADYNFELVNAITDDGVLYVACQPTNSVSDVYIQISLGVEMYEAVPPQPRLEQPGDNGFVELITIK